MTFSHYLYLDEIFVKNKFRNAGIATMLLDSSKKLARRKGIKIIQARIWTFNRTMRRFFLKRGGEEIYSVYLMHA